MHLFSLVHHDMLKRVVLLQGLLQARQDRLVAYHESHSVRGHSLNCRVSLRLNVSTTQII